MHCGIWTRFPNDTYLEKHNQLINSNKTILLFFNRSLKSPSKKFKFLAKQQTSHKYTNSIRKSLIITLSIGKNEIKQFFSCTEHLKSINYFITKELRWNLDSVCFHYSFLTLYLLCFSYVQFKHASCFLSRLI
jgi:hypothetical protein